MNKNEKAALFVLGATAATFCAGFLLKKFDESSVTIVKHDRTVTAIAANDYQSPEDEPVNPMYATQPLFI